jgi:ubiquinol oxidase
LDLHLSNEDVKRAEMIRENSGGKIDAHPISRKLYDIGCFFLDKLFEERPLERFWFLETVARIPYFAYVSMLHIYETFGWWREPSLRKIHNAEEWNELHHLLILECLGADKVINSFIATSIVLIIV